VLSERVRGEATVTEYPVEQGANKGDHKRPNLTIIDLEVVISNCPVVLDPRPRLTYNDKTSPPRFDADFTNAGIYGRPGDNARDVLEFLRTDPGTVTVVLGNDGPCARRHESFEVTAVDAPRDVKLGDQFKASLSFKELQVAQSQQVAISSTNPAGATANRGTQPTTPASPATSTAAGSALHAIVYGSGQ
jgi:hypothetical protein